ncbi:MAG: glucodextranase DOMON-like domain-containing protein, partial [Promethearchaeota archaeon]
DYAYSIVQTAISSHDAIQDEGRMEIITTPFYHPILPLLIDLNSAREVNDGVADLALPTQNTLWTEDALIQIEKGKAYTASLFGEEPKGMWPSEEAVSDDIIPLVNQTGIEWFVTDYTVLENSLGVSELTPEQWFQPYVVEKDGYSSVAFFRHQQLSDEIGFNYGGLDPEVAANNMIDLLKDIRDNWTNEEDPVFTVALDGENAWENYQFDLNGDSIMDYTGNLFREYMYQKLEEAQVEGWLQTITPSQYLADHPANTLETVSLATGSWATDLTVWIGEDEENQAWDRLITTRKDLLDYMDANEYMKEDLPDAWEALYAAEGSDWFWWFGADKDSGHDELFDWQFKTILRGVYKEIGWTDTDIMEAYPYLFLEMLPPVSAQIQGKYLPNIDGILTASEEWSLAASYPHAEANNTDRLFKDIYLGVDEALDALHLRFDTTDSFSLDSIGDYSVGLYFSNPKAQFTTIFPRFADPLDNSEILGFELNKELRIELDTGISSIYEIGNTYAWEQTAESASVAIDDFVEVSIPLSVLGVEKGDQIYLRFVATNDSNGENFDVTPEDGPWMLNIPFGGVNMVEVFSMTDPAWDEHGIYPTNPEMHPDYDVNQTGLMDIIRFRVGYIDDIVYFEFKFRELFNPWGGPGGYSHPLMQVYIDQDQITGSGRTDCDQNGHFTIEEDHAWEYMVRADGWLQYILLEDDSQISGVSTFSDSVDNIIVFSAPASVIGIPQKMWAYTVVVGSQDYQAFREFFEVEQEWKFGGGDDSYFDPNVIDVLLPANVDQNAILNDYDPVAELFCTIPAVYLEPDTIAPTIDILTTVTEYTLTADETTVDVEILFAASDNEELTKIDVSINDLLDRTLASNVSSITLTLSVGTYEINLKAVDAWENEAEMSITIIILPFSDETDDHPTDDDGGSRISGFSIGMFAILSLSAIVWIAKRRWT